MLLLALTAPALAQAPRITPAGDPTVKDDTIYRLAVNAADHADDDYIYLLDDGVVRLEADGRGSRTYRQVVQILTREAAETWGEQSFSYVSGRERLTLNWIRVVKPTGEVISSQPAHEQESIAPVAQEAPVFSDAKVRRVSSGGIAPGTLLDYSYTVETLKPVMPGDFQRGWRGTTGRCTAGWRKTSVTSHSRSGSEASSRASPPRCSRPGTVTARTRRRCSLRWPGDWGCAPIRCCCRAAAGSRATGRPLWRSTT